MKSFKKGYDGMLFRFVLFLVRRFLHIIFRLRVHGTENMPQEGAVIVALNHKSYWDAVLAVTHIPRKLNFMAKKELFRYPVLKSIIKWAGAFPVNRGASDLGAIKTALSILRSQNAMAIFPEGRRVFKNEAHTAKAGVAMLAEKTGAPVVPVAIAGRYRLFAKIDLYIGEPMYVKSKDGKKLTGEELRQFSDELLAKILYMAGEQDAPTPKENSTWTLE
ncbi:MAG: 1-acyl-sn-glycerol-3-phosphate acyltransferase [Ruminococcaceae bacterium]|nr:1-acyl-sn-glycerol-3-phosphate acyltransferase [Oscillospiraceae bacterium]